MRERHEQMRDRTRRHFPEAAGSGVPTLSVISPAAGVAAGRQEGGEAERRSHKFTTVDLGPYFNAGPAEFGPREKARSLSGPSRADGLIHMPTGQQHFRGIPFRL